MAACNTRPRLSEMSPDAVEYFMEKLLFNIYNCFDEQEHIDVTFKLANPDALVTAHRVILTAASSYFRDLFRSEKGICPVIEINDIDSDTFEHLITFCYTGKMCLTTDNVESILKAALTLQLDDAFGNCIDFIMKNMSEFTLQRAYALKAEMKCPILERKMFEYETRNFMSVIQSSLNFEANKLQKLLECNDLNVPTEKQAFEALEKWYKHDTVEREQQLPNLITCLRLTQLETNFLLAAVQTLPGCELIILNALSWKNCPSVRPNLTLKYTSQRKSQSLSHEFFALHLDTSDEQDKTIFQYDKSEDSWQKWLDLKISVSDFKVIFMDQNLIFVGGTRNNKAITEVTSLNCKTKTFKHLPRMNQPRKSHSLAILNGTIYAIGGRGVRDEPLDSVEMYSTSKGWKSINGMIKPRYDAGAVALSGKLYVIGGEGHSNTPESVECYDPAKGDWTRCANLYKSYLCPSVTVHNGQIYILGRYSFEWGFKLKRSLEVLHGYGTAIRYSSAVERYDPQRDKWTKICSLSSARDGIGSTSFDNQLWIVGGTSDKSVSVYDEVNDAWLDKNPILCFGSYYCFTAPKSLFQSECN